MIWGCRHVVAQTCGAKASPALSVWVTANVCPALFVQNHPTKPVSFDAPLSWGGRTLPSLYSEVGSSLFYQSVWLTVSFLWGFLPFSVNQNLEGLIVLSCLLIQAFAEKHQIGRLWKTLDCWFRDILLRFRRVELYNTWGIWLFLFLF